MPPTTHALPLTIKGAVLVSMMIACVACGDRRNDDQAVDAATATDGDASAWRDLDSHFDDDAAEPETITDAARAHDAGDSNDAGVTNDAGVANDAGATNDAGVTNDAGASNCSSTFSDVTRPLCSGTYPQNVTASTFAPGSTIEAAVEGGVRFTGSIETGHHLTFRGIVFDTPNQKALGENNLFEDCSFVRGPSCGNTVNAAVGSNTTIRRSAFYGKGGRYLLLAYRTSGVVIEDVIFRRDGGWGSNSPTCTEYEPTAGLNFYDSGGAVGLRIVAFDAINEAHSSAEDIGEFVVNCHETCTSNVFRDAFVKDALSGAYRYEGHGTVADAELSNSVALGGAYGITRNVLGTTFATNVSIEGSAAACASWTGNVVLSESHLDGANQCTGIGNGAGAALTLNSSFLDRVRWRQEMCDGQSVTRGWCATSLPLSDYLNQ